MEEEEEEDMERRRRRRRRSRRRRSRRRSERSWVEEGAGAGGGARGGGHECSQRVSWWAISAGVRPCRVVARQPPRVRPEVQNPHVPARHAEAAAPCQPLRHGHRATDTSPPEHLRRLSPSACSSSASSSSSPPLPRQMHRTRRLYSYTKRDEPAADADNEKQPTEPQDARCSDFCSGRGGRLGKEASVGCGAP